MAKIYTKTGDGGSSKIITGKRVSKGDLLFEVLGNIDELNAVLGLLSFTKNKELAKIVRNLQADLFQISSYFAGVSFTDKDFKWINFRTEQIEIAIDEKDIKNVPLQNFILPGGSLESAQLHFARTVCRRVERTAVRLVTSKKSFEDLVKTISYFNRLADFLFVLARYHNNKGMHDINWKKTA
jgi:cob(I)alamin adenosyltransferase